MSVVDFDAAKRRLAEQSPPHPILEALDALGAALAAHGHEWTDREHHLYETAVAYVIGSRKGSGS